ncbi:lanthionine synthetase LanC family protein [Parabacteroides johnsonii]|uniref:lanthionine synthetase LanC family protein n=1 Tax=Parabacteroides johnsonii TaxID=387661 RepID=UPI00242CA62A|nr:lanthionine synthetase LanC family protein [Parabacteroides johnsonii]
MDENKDGLLKQIADHLIVNSSFLPNLGLYHGRMGIVLFFVNYARYTDNYLYQEYAEYLLDDILEDLHSDIALDFENGLSGIGWGILYLLKAHFMEGDPDEVLSDIDRKIMEVSLSRVTDRSVERGLGGYLYYLLERLSVASERSILDVSYKMELQEVLSVVQLKELFDLQSLIRQNTVCSIVNIARDLLGIQDGYAGYGFKLMQV